MLLEITPSPVVRLNHAVAVAMVHNTQAGLQALLKLQDDPSLKKYHLFHATLGELYNRNGDSENAMQCYRAAQALTENEAEKRFLEKKLGGVS
jgi:RNA polymerase sigma-70 factor (ECF subfamily)